ncbi:hypothetical protein FKW77_010028 [Venturia effusa]|uniref:Uncharacterized protein n=1 Tax=Venturia effusa TaxID=50376 RepID=A0A517L4F0_9PEZI|nr:hypothetical protein FKW77_010028 [Venturia effusa]
MADASILGQDFDDDHHIKPDFAKMNQPAVKTKASGPDLLPVKIEPVKREEMFNRNKEAPSDGSLKSPDNSLPSLQTQKAQIISWYGNIASVIFQTFLILPAAASWMMRVEPLSPFEPLLLLAMIWGWSGTLAGIASDLAVKSLRPLLDKLKSRGWVFEVAKVEDRARVYVYRWFFLVRCYTVYAVVGNPVVFVVGRLQQLVESLRA